MAFTNNRADPPVNVTWYFVDDVEPLPRIHPYYSRFASGNWAYHHLTELWTGPGEISAWPKDRPYYNGLRPRPPGVSNWPCGSPRSWANGVTFPWPAEQLGARGTPSCCQTQVQDAGLGLGFETIGPDEPALALAFETIGPDEPALALSFDAWEVIQNAVCPLVPLQMYVLLPDHWEPYVPGPPSPTPPPPTGAILTVSVDGGHNYLSEQFNCLGGNMYYLRVTPGFNVTYGTQTWDVGLEPVVFGLPSASWQVFPLNWPMSVDRCSIPCEGSVGDSSAIGWSAPFGFQFKFFSV